MFTVIVEYGSAEIPSEICETPNSSCAKSRRKERKRENKNKRRLKEKSKIDCEGKYSPTLVTGVKTNGISFTLSGSKTQHRDLDAEGLIHSDNGNVTVSCEEKISQISEKDNKIVNAIRKLKHT